MRTHQPPLAYGLDRKVSRRLRLVLFLTSCSVLAALLTGFPHREGTSASAVQERDARPPARQVEATVRFNRENNRIEISGPGSVATLRAIKDAIKNDSLLEQSGGEYLLKTSIKLFDGVTLELHGRSAGGDVDWLKLKSEKSGYVSIESSNGSISIRGTKITSWDTSTGTFDNAIEDGSGRAFISAKNRSAAVTGNRMDVIDSEVAYLGFFEETAYGISWKVLNGPDKADTGILGKGITGTISGSKFHHNYFGVYVYGVGGMEVRNNEFYNNTRYGFDAHTFAQGTIVERNSAHDNGTHGIIFADRSTGNIVRLNTVTNNKGHGIILHESSGENTIEDNTVIGNDDGVPLFESSDNRISRNTIRDNKTGIRVYGREAASSRNIFESNEVSGSKGFGVYVYDGSTDNVFRDNRVTGSGDAGFFMDGVFDNIIKGNTITGNRTGVHFDSSAGADKSRGNQVLQNQIWQNSEWGIISYAPEGSAVLEDNTFSNNGRGDVQYIARGVLPLPKGPGARGIRALPWFGPLVIAAVISLALVSRLLVRLKRRESIRRESLRR